MIAIWLSSKLVRWSEKELCKFSLCCHFFQWRWSSFFSLSFFSGHFTASIIEHSFEVTWEYKIATSCTWNLFENFLLQNKKLQVISLWFQFFCGTSQPYVSTIISMIIDFLETIIDLTLSHPRYLRIPSLPVYWRGSDLGTNSGNWVFDGMTHFEVLWIRKSHSQQLVCLRDYQHNS